MPCTNPSRFTPLFLLLVACGGREPAGEPERRDAPSPSTRPESPTAMGEHTRPAVPEPDPFPMYGVATHFVSRVYDAPRERATEVGYFRRGSTFRASERVPGAGCERGWHRVPQGGFVCRAVGFQIGTSPQTYTPAPLPAHITEAMPYAYAFVSRKSAPQYLRIPTVEEEATVEALFAELDARDALRADGGVPDAGVDGGIADGGVADAAVATIEGEPPSDDSALTNVIDGGAATPDDGLPDYVRMRMLRKFYVSVDGTETDGDRTFTRTVRGAYVRDTALTPNEPSTRQGLTLTATQTLPVAFVYRTEIMRYVHGPSGGAPTLSGPIAQHTGFFVTGTEGSGSTRYVTSSEGFLVRESAVRVARLRARPSRVPEGVKWIHVDLSEQTLVAYEGDRPVYATTVSSGRPGFGTPTGTYRIRSKHVSTTMDDLAAGDDAYSIEDVPWTMYYDGGYALHTAFWHNQFGRVRSHGCTNLAPRDARWIFHWSTPTVPPGLHGVSATTRDPGTYIFIES